MINPNNIKIGIVNYSIGNVGSVLCAFDFYGFDVSLVGKPNQLSETDIIVLAGVGNFSTATKKLKETRFWETLNELVLVKKKPVLGICLGMQIFAQTGYEDGENDGLGWIKGKTIKMQGKHVRLPHIGWDKVKPLKTKLFEKIRHNSFYFMHSYHFVPEDKKVIIATTNYCGLSIVSAVQKGNIVGTQFHPEKSQGDGLRLLKNAVGLFL